MEQQDQQRRLNVLIHRMAQSLLVHDDFIILPQNPENEQEKVAKEDMARPLVLFRRRWNTLQIIRLMPADGLGSTHIERMMREESHFLTQARKSNAVRNMYAFTVFIFSQWRSDENLRAIGEAGSYQGLTKSIGADAMAIDLARGVTGPLPQGPAVREIKLQTLVDMAAHFPEETYPEEVLNRSREEWRTHLIELSDRKQERLTAVLRPQEKTPVMRTLLVVTILIWLIVLQYPDYMLYIGLLIPELIRIGELWRLITPVFLHYDFTHIAFNMVSLFIFGSYAERIYGRGRFVAIYLLAGISGSMLSFAFNDHASLGASGAVFGLFGALLAFGQLDRKAFAMTIGTTIYAMVALNLIMGFLTPQVNNLGHIGGLIGGYLVARAFGLPQRESKWRWLYAMLYGAGIALLYGVGMNMFGS